MSAGWVAAGVRARAMGRRRLGRRGTGVLGSSPSLEAALVTLAGTAYGREVRSGQDLAQAQRGVTATWLWNVRVLAGWAPRSGVALLRPLVAPLEVADTVDHLRALAGLGGPPPYRLGGLATAWPRLATTTSAAEVRTVLAASPWGDPGDDEPRGVGLAMRAALADRVVARVPVAAAWAAGALALVAAGLLAAEAAPPAGYRTSAQRVLGRAATAAGDLPSLRRSLPRTAAWALAGVDGPAGLWRAEAAWWQRVERDARALVARPTPGAEPVVGTVALLAVDAWRVRAALELASRGGVPVEGFDAVA
ncbi:hypothetical protein ACFUC1_13785 [Pedococcus sp. NPDC057267]|uniref:hypothetical protein n=1 Tax=Pedococcus sp. NPDC057267 TaxID=3346077 RepID=UPI003627B376